MLAPLILLALASRRRASPASAPSTEPGGPSAPPASDYAGAWVWPLPELDADRAAELGLRPRPTVSDGPGPGKRRRPDGTPRWHAGADVLYKRAARVFPAPQGESPWFAAPLGTPVLAVRDGKVWSVAKLGSGWRVVLDHGRPWSSAYYHLVDPTLPPVGRGERNTRTVRAGEVLGYVGANPRDKEGIRHLHFELHHQGRWTDPAPMLARAATVRV